MVERIPTRARPLDGLRVIECSSFVAGPSGCMTLSMLGADVIRVDPIGGSADFGRWPLANDSTESLFWNSLNRGKKSVSINSNTKEGRELVVALATASGPDSGVLLDNTGRSWLAHDQLSRHRSDMVSIRIQGHADGRPAVDYTINPSVGVPSITGSADSTAPVNHALPAWDLLTGMTATTALLAALRHRDRSGEGSDLSVALADVAMSGLASLGWLAEVDQGGDRCRGGNYLYGSFGVDFETIDNQRVMVVALTSRHWSSLVSATQTAHVFAALESAMGIDLTDEGCRYRQREVISAILRPWFEHRTMAQVKAVLNAERVLWSRYRSMAEMVVDQMELSDSGVLTTLNQPGIGTIVSGKSPIRSAGTYVEPLPAPRLGQDTDLVLGSILGIDDNELANLHDRGILGDVA